MPKQSSQNKIKSRSCVEKFSLLIRLCIVVIACFFSFQTFSQTPQILNRIGGLGSSGGGERKDSIAFEHRDDSKDSISVTFRYLDSTNRQTMDSSVSDYDVYYPIPAHYNDLGNNGAAAYSLIYQPYSAPGWDAGFHAFDIYKFKLEDTKFYRTRRPFSTLSYGLATGQEQMIQASHTQTPSPNVNFGFDYRLVNAPGLFASQGNNHNAIRLYGDYVSKRKRYSGTFVFVSNVIRANQNGGLVNDSSLADPSKLSRFSIPVNIGGDETDRQNPFKTSVATGNIYKGVNIMLQQYYNIGKTDSIAINDSTTEYLFYPKLRIQHTVKYETSKNTFNDFNADSARYKSWYNIDFRGNSSSNDTLLVKEDWQVITNDLSLLQFPDTKNSSQFFLAGISYQNMTRQVDSIAGSDKYFNAFVHGEYRNRTRNKLWNIVASGNFYLAGLNAGDYKASATISRSLRKYGDVELFFNNTSRRPSFIFDDRSAYNLGDKLSLKKENITSFGATINNKIANVFFANHLLANYTYFKSFTERDQYSKPINVLQIGASKKVRIAKHINWYPEVVLQQTDGAAPIIVPLFYTRNRVAFEGQFFKNLSLSTGIEVKYNSPIKAYNFTPVQGDFLPQDTLTISNLPEVHAYVHFRIKGFSAFFRVENLNTFSVANGFNFTNNNFAAPLYPTEALYLRFGIRWWFIN